MNTTEACKPAPVRDDFVRWGTAPEDRQCRYELASGHHCRRWTARGREFCRQHGAWMDTRVDGPIEVPLMEDASAVQIVASQTARAMAWGQIPPANGRGILHACRVAQTGFAQTLAEAKFRLKCQQLGLPVDQFLPTPAAGATLNASLDLGGNQRASAHCASTEKPVAQAEPPQTSETAPAAGAVSVPIARSTIAAEAPAFRPGESCNPGESEGSSQGEVDLESATAPLPLKDPSLTASSLEYGPSNPLDDLPPAPRPKSVCEPCVAALVQGADESLLDCDHCPAALAGNLRAPQLPDPRNPPEQPESGYPMSPEVGYIGKRPAFRNLKTNWDRSLARFSDQCAGERYPARRLQTDEEYAAERAAIRARPFEEHLHPPRTSPPPPIPAGDPPR